MVLYDKKGGISKVYPVGSDGHWRFYRVLEVLHEIDRRRLERLLNKKKKREERVGQILDEPDKKNYPKDQEEKA